MCLWIPRVQMAEVLQHGSLYHHSTPQLGFPFAQLHPLQDSKLHEGRGLPIFAQYYSPAGSTVHGMQKIWNKYLLHEWKFAPFPTHYASLSASLELESSPDKNRWVMKYGQRTVGGNICAYAPQLHFLTSPIWRLWSNAKSVVRVFLKFCRKNISAFSFLESVTAIRCRVNNWLHIVNSYVSWFKLRVLSFYILYVGPPFYFIDIYYTSKWYILCSIANNLVDYNNEF